MGESFQAFESVPYVLWSLKSTSTSQQEVCKTGHKLLVQPFKSLIREHRAKEILISSLFCFFLVQVKLLY